MHINGHAQFKPMLLKGHCICKRKLSKKYKD